SRPGGSVKAKLDLDPAVLGLDAPKHPGMPTLPTDAYHGHRTGGKRLHPRRHRVADTGLEGGPYRLHQFRRRIDLGVHHHGAVAEAAATFVVTGPLSLKDPVVDA